jgi:hypothetical protein
MGVIGTNFPLTVNELAVLPNGNVIAGGDFFGGPSVGIAMWNGATWMPMGTGVEFSPPYFQGMVDALAVLPNSDVMIGGRFWGAGSEFLPYIARWAPLRPEILDHPDSVSLDAGQTAALSAIARAATGSVNYQWHRNGLPIENGAGGASTGGGVVSGASGSLPSASSPTQVTLAITSATTTDAGTYTVAFAGSCGTEQSTSATVTVSAICPADLNGDDIVDDDDFLVFVIAYNILDCSDATMPLSCPSDFDRSLVVDDVDFLIFVPAYDRVVCN